MTEAIDRSERDHPLVIVGPTASGKTALAVAVAERVGRCEIVSADAMAIYRQMNIGTAKPPENERHEIPHHLIDVVDPDNEYTVAQFQTHVHRVLHGIQGRRNRAVVVGGTGLYVRAVVDNFEVPPQFVDVRQELETESDSQKLWRWLDHLDPAAASKMNPTNRRRIVRALEVTLGAGRPFSSFGPGVDAYPPTRFVQIGLNIERGILDQRINQRIDQQLAAGWLDEVRELQAVELSRTAAKALGYAELLAHVNGELDLDEAVADIKKRTRKFARRQQRWFRRDPRITWLDHDRIRLVDEVIQRWNRGQEGDKQG